MQKVFLSDDLISRQAAIKAICEDGTWLESQGCTEITMVERKQRDADILGELPSAQLDLSEYSDRLWKAAYERGKAEAIPSTQKTAEWIEHKYECECSSCGEEWDYCDNDVDRFIYCPNCGAKMEGDT